MMFGRTKILILGDSYAELTPPLIRKDDYANHSTGPSWTFLLDENPRYKVTNLAESGSSIWFSFRNFICHHMPYDKIIFVATQPTRLYCPIDCERPIKHHTHHHPRRNKLREHYREIDPTHTVVEKIDAVDLYFKHIIDLEERAVVQRLMIKEIRDIRPDTILIPAFHDSIFDYEGACLFDISKNELKDTNMDYSKLHKTHDDMRACHMIDENNRIFYEHVLRWIDGENVSLHVDDFKVMSIEHVDRYCPIFF